MLTVVVSGDYSDGILNIFEKIIDTGFDGLAFAKIGSMMQMVQFSFSNLVKICLLVGREPSSTIKIWQMPIFFIS